MQEPKEVRPEDITTPICHPRACGCPDCSRGIINPDHFYAPSPARCADPASAER